MGGITHDVLAQLGYRQLAEDSRLPDSELEKVLSKRIHRRKVMIRLPYEMRFDLGIPGWQREQL